MSFPSSQTLPSRKRDNLNKLNPMKSILQSMTIWGAIIALISRFVGLEISAGEANDIITEAASGWPMIAGLFADVTAAAKRIGATKFDRHWYQSPVFWSALVAGIMGVLQSIGVNWAGLETLPQQVGGVVVAIGGILGPIIMLIGRARASKVVGPPGANTKLGIVNVSKIPWWALLILKAVPWHELLSYVLQRLKINPELWAKARNLVLMVDPQPVTGAEKSLAVYDRLERSMPDAKPHERHAVVGLAVAALKLENKI
jgi:uncharacterized membrane protein